MTRALKPGDVVTGTNPIHPERQVRGIIDIDGRFYTPDRELVGVLSRRFVLDDLRPLAVIDPEGPSANRLMHVMGTRFRGTMNDLREVLSQFVEPTIDEPTGLGAVVEDKRGRKFVRVGDHRDGWTEGKQWQRIGGNIGAKRKFGWSDLSPARVLTEGVDL